MPDYVIRFSVPTEAVVVINADSVDEATDLFYNDPNATNDLLDFRSYWDDIEILQIREES